jgi:NAD(P)-dependent dehydrogenase (short-subunit alcohol dehydrogenase family)
VGFFDLSGQAALVTGAARGIGAGVSERLARAGANVGVGDLDLGAATALVERLAGEGLQAFPIQLDVSDKSSVHAAVRTVISRCGRLDILVNNAGIAGKAAPVWEQSDEDWDSVLAVDLTGVF